MGSEDQYGGVLLTSVPHSDPGDCDSRVGDTARGSGKDCTIIIQAGKGSKGAKGQMVQKGKRRKRRLSPQSRQNGAAGQGRWRQRQQFG
jgi:hypothetical protein